MRSRLLDRPARTGGPIRSRPYDAPGTLEPGPTGLVVRQLKNLVLCCPTALAILALCSFPLILAGVLNNWFGGLAAILVAVILPVVLIADLLVLCLALGFLAWPLMAVSIAAENSDTFDALSRCYNYAFTRPIRFVFLNVIAIGLASIPTVIVQYPLADVIGGLPPPGSDPILAGCHDVSLDLLVVADASLSPHATGCRRYRRQ